MRRRLALLLLGLSFVSQGQAADHAAVLLYHHVSDDTPPSTSVSPRVFRQQLDFLATGGFTVLPLSRILDTLAAGGSLPDKSVAITFDDAYQSVLEVAAPLLKQRHWPFTVFVSTRAVDEGYHDYLSWDGLRRLMDVGAEIGNHSYSHAHLVRRAVGESARQWHERVTRDIRRAQDDLRRRLGVTPTMFSYPYGEYDTELQRIVASLGFYGIAQQSGAVGADFDKLEVPRYPQATHYEGMQRFAISVKSRPLPVRKVSAAPRIRTAGELHDQRFAFDVTPDGYRPARLACYDSSSGTRLTLSKTDDDGALRVSVPLPDWGPGRRKINCTAPSSHERGVYFWYSYLWLVKQADGSWYDE